jgi:hypothetical protein
MEENSHVSLDHKAAEILRNRILAQIAKVEVEIARESALEIASRN